MVPSLGNMQLNLLHLKNFAFILWSVTGFIPSARTLEISHLPKLHKTNYV